MESISLPLMSGAKKTTRLGLGTASLMREPSRRKRMYVLEAAYDAGFRHFDTAPLYGLGAAESELGDFLSRTTGDCTVATKYGLLPSDLAKLLAKVQRPMRAAIRRSGTLRRAVRSVGNVARASLTAPTIGEFRQSVESSLSAMQLDFIDIVLMHDMPWSERSADFWEGLRSSDQIPGVGLVGVAGDSTLLSHYPTDFLRQLPLVQTVTTPLPGKVSLDLPHFIIQYGALSLGMKQLSLLLVAKPKVRRELESIVGHEVVSLENVADFICCLSLASAPGSMLLVGTTTARHAERIWKACERDLTTFQQHRESIVSTLTSHSDGDRDGSS